MVKKSWQQERQAAGHVCLSTGSGEEMVELSWSHVQHTGSGEEMEELSWSRV